MKIAFFGSSNFSVYVLNELQKFGLTPQVIVTSEDKLKGRKMILSPSITKSWAEKNNILTLTPVKLDGDFANKFTSSGVDLSIVASYGKIIPKNILEIPKFKTINIHPSLLPKLRGPSPIQSAILSENNTGVSIIELDEFMDHGPILSQDELGIEWPPYADELEKKCAVLGTKLLVDVIEKILNNDIKKTAQDDNLATFTKKIKKSDAQLNLSESANINLRKIRAFNIWPQAYFIDENKKRVIVKKAKIEKEKLILERVIPEGKKEMNYEDYLRGKKN